jgi:hypothetical protein
LLLVVERRVEISQGRLDRLHGFQHCLHPVPYRC